MEPSNIFVRYILEIRVLLVHDELILSPLTRNLIVPISSFPDTLHDVKDALVDIALARPLKTETYAQLVDRVTWGTPKSISMALGDLARFMEYLRTTKNLQVPPLQALIVWANGPHLPSGGFDIIVPGWSTMSIPQKRVAHDAILVHIENSSAQCMQFRNEPLRQWVIDFEPDYRYRHAVREGFKDRYPAGV
jgi:hypothetical protein